MFFILSKTLYFFLMPMSMVFLLIGTGIVIKKTIWKKRLIYSGIGLFIFFSNPFLSNVSMKAWEGSPTVLKSLKHHDIGVILTGITNRYKTPNDRVYIERGADRVLHTIQLYKLNLIRRILISGGSGKLIENAIDLKEADELKRVLLLAGIPDSVIVLESNSRNTYESAIETSEMIKNRFPNQSALLVTSAFHLPRASACFKNQECNFTTFGTDYYSHDREYNLDDFIVPKSSAIKNWEILIREFLGLSVYWVLGYI